MHAGRPHHPENPTGVSMESRKVERFSAVSDDGRVFHITAWQEWEPQRFGRVSVRMIPIIQNLETDEGLFARPTPDGRYELPQLGLRVTRLDSTARPSGAALAAQ